MDEIAFKNTMIALKRSGLAVENSCYSPEAFGSWWILLSQSPLTRIVWDGKDELLIIKRKACDSSNEWDDKWIARNHIEQTPEKVVETVHCMK